MVRIRMIAAAAAAALAPALALAQASAPSMGAERPTTGTPGKGSTTTREARKAETVEARKKGELTPAGGGAGPAPKSTKHSTMTKEKRKAETMEARKKGELVPAGGGSPAPAK